MKEGFIVARPDANTKNIKLIVETPLNLYNYAALAIIMTAEGKRHAYFTTTT